MQLGGETSSGRERASQMHFLLHLPMVHLWSRKAHHLGLCTRSCLPSFNRYSVFFLEGPSISHPIQRIPLSSLHCSLLNASRASQLTLTSPDAEVFSANEAYLANNKFQLNKWTLANEWHMGRVCVLDTLWPIWRWTKKQLSGGIKESLNRTQMACPNQA